MNKISQIDGDMKTALVTGASGDIGRAICNCLQSNNFVTSQEFQVGG